nr:myxosortase-dependent M36 family metallopeptidase [Myxococcus sp. RHSTA-1-4]
MVATLSGLALVLSGTGAAARTLPNYDALQDAKPSGRASAGFKPVNPVKGARVAHRDERTGSPTFIWAHKTPAQTSLRAQFAGMAPEQAALAQVQDHAALFGLSSFEAAGAKVVSVSQNRQGVKVVKMAQEAGGIEVFRQNLNLLLNRDNELVAISGSLSNQVSNTAPEARLHFKLPATRAISVAYKDLTGNDLDPSLLARTNIKQETGAYSHYTLATYARPLAQGLVIPARVKQVLFPLPTALVPAYYVELNTGAPDSNDSDYYAYVISAADGSLLLRNNLTAHAEFSYRVFADTTPPYTPHDGPTGAAAATPHPTGSPNGFRPAYVPPALVTLESAPFSHGDPWLPNGATVTTGNNVDAYADLVAPDYYSEGDLRPTATAPGVFDRTMLFDIAPNANAEQIAAATTSLFFMNNWLHDWYYDTGFDEASGNAQADNYGRGGLGNDPIHAQAQDYTNINNANMSTPADGASPRMQMYLFTGPRNARVTVTAPASIAGDYLTGIAAGFGPQAFDATGDVVAALDESNASGPSTTDACTPLTNAAEVAGKFALVDRGTCGFAVKAAVVQAAGAIGFILADNTPRFIVDMGGTASGITIPSLLVTQADGARLRGALAEGVTARMFRGPTIGVDGTVDNQIVAHEWGHYISNRLISNGSGLVNNQGRAMGEGWADFHALLMTVRAEDIDVPSNPDWTGVYAMAEYATRGISPDSSFYGIRRGAYSVNEDKNALRFRHIMNGVALPTTTPFAPGGVNSQVHNSGEIWASTLWECYVSLLRAHPFQEAQDRMKSYIVNGYKLTPPSPTYLEARDAILAAVLANDPADFQRFWAAFAWRGMGVGAVAPDRYSTDHSGVVESYVLGVDVELVSVAYEDSVATPGDADGILDNGETGTIAITVANKGSSEAAATSATVVSTTPGVKMGNRGFVNFPAIPVGATETVHVPVTLSGASLGQRAEVAVAIRDDGQVVQSDKSMTLNIRVNYDEVPAATATETVEASEANLPWVSDHDARLASADFSVVEFSDFNRAYYGPNMGAASDLRLTSPELQVSSTEPFSLTFRHSYDFEADADGNYDGAVIELSEDNGATWVDVGDALYTGELIQYAGNRNPLAGRRAIVGTTPDFPEFITSTLNLGDAYAGKTVRIRFRIGSDNGAGNTGWVLDDLAFSGITNRPFTKICADSGVCGNTAPVASAGADMAVDERAQVSLAGSAYDLDGNALTYAWEQLDGPEVTLTGDTTLTPSFTAPEVTADTSVVLLLTVSDGTATSEDLVTVLVRHVNRAPTANAGLDAIADERGAVTLSGSASDPEDDALTYLWTQVSGTAVALRNYDTATATFIAPETDVGETLTFRLTVSDGQASTSDTVDVRIDNVNRAPVVTASSVTIDERSTAIVEATASDPDGDALTYTWIQTAGDEVVFDGAGTARITFSTGEVAADAVLRFQVTVSDGTASLQREVAVNVRHINRAPTVNAGLDLAADERSSVTLSGSASDADQGDTLTYAWTQVSGTPVALSGANGAMATFTAPNTASGETLTFRLTVSDGQATTSDTVDVVVNSNNTVPVARARIILSGNQTSMILDGSESGDPDGDAITYKWEQTGGPSVSLANADQAVINVDVPELDDDSATFTFRLTVTDARGGSHTATVEAMTTPDTGGCSSTGAGAPAGMLGLALLSLLRRRRKRV